MLARFPQIIRGANSCIYPPHRQVGPVGKAAQQLYYVAGIATSFKKIPIFNLSSNNKTPRNPLCHRLDKDDRSCRRRFIPPTLSGNLVDTFVIGGRSIHACAYNKKSTAKEPKNSTHLIIILSEEETKTHFCYLFPQSISQKTKSF